MKSIFFTKPKEHTLDCVKFLVEQKEELLGIVIWDAGKYENGRFMAYCRNKGIRVFDGDEIYRCPEGELEELDVVYANTYPRLIRKELIEKANFGGINFHSAPLPQYRGVFGYNFAIFNQEKEYGVTAHSLGEKFDNGTILEVDRFPIDPETITVEALVRLSEKHLLGLFRKCWARLSRGENITCLPNEGGRYYSRADFERLKQIEQTDDGDTIKRKVRAAWFPPYEGAYIRAGQCKYMLVDEKAWEDFQKNN